MNNEKKHNLSGFTLIELLVIISIIAFLATIGIVAFTAARNKARISKGLNFSQSVNNALGSEAVGIWTFDEGSGMKILDGSGAGNDGTLMNGPVWNCAEADNDYTPSGKGCSLYFDGLDDYAVIENNGNLQISGDLSISWWSNANSFEGSRTLMSKGGFPYEFNIEFRDSGGRILFTFGDGTTYNSPYNLYPPGKDLNKWYHYTIVKNESKKKVYLYQDGSKVSSFSYTIDAVESARNLYIGSINGGSRYFNGSIDDVRVYGHVIESAQVKSLYYAGLKKLLSKKLLENEEYEQRIVLN